MIKSLTNIQCPCNWPRLRPVWNGIDVLLTKFRGLKTINNSVNNFKSNEIKVIAFSNFSPFGQIVFFADVMLSQSKFIDISKCFKLESVSL